MQQAEALAMLEAAIRLEKAQILSMSSPVLGRVAAACRQVGSEISMALEGRQRVGFQKLCELVEKQVEEGVVEVVITPRTVTEYWGWMVRVLLVVILVVALRRCQGWIGQCVNAVFHRCQQQWQRRDSVIRRTNAVFFTCRQYWQRFRQEIVWQRLDAVPDTPENFASQYLEAKFQRLTL